jgi:sphingomyelin phosphodiesterase acid-like 3
MKRAALRFALVAALILGGGATVTAEPRSAAQQPLIAAPGQGVFLHVSDIHFNPLYDPSLAAELIAAPIERWDAIFQTSSITAPSASGSDSNHPLFSAMIQAAGRTLQTYDYVLNTGDNLAHDFHDTYVAAGGAEADYDDFVAKTMLYVDWKLEQAFAGVPLVSAFGNNDALCGDYRLTPGSPLLAETGRGLPVVAGDPQALRDISIGGSYVTPHPVVKDHDFLVLGNVFWSSQYENACGMAADDPGSAQLAWLEWTLFRERLAGRSVSLIMHIPPGINAYSASRSPCAGSPPTMWTDPYTARFLALIAAYRDVVTDAYAAHTHMDDFRVISAADGTPIVPVRLTPSVSPVFANSPSFTLFLYDRASAAPLNYVTYVQDSSPAGPDHPLWRFSYNFRQTYGSDDYSAASLAALASRIQSQPATRQTWAAHYTGAAPTPINAGDWKAFACAQTGLTPDAYETCTCPGATRQ